MRVCVCLYVCMCVRVCVCVPATGTALFTLPVLGCLISAAVIVARMVLRVQVITCLLSNETLLEKVVDKKVISLFNDIGTSRVRHLAPCCVYHRVPKLWTH